MRQSKRQRFNNVAIEDDLDTTFIRLKTKLSMLNELIEVFGKSNDPIMNKQIQIARNEIRMDVYKLTQQNISLVDVYAKIGGGLYKAQVLQANDYLAKKDNQNDNHITDLVNEDQELFKRLQRYDQQNSPFYQQRVQQARYNKLGTVNLQIEPALPRQAPADLSMQALADVLRNISNQYQQRVNRDQSQRQRQYEANYEIQQEHNVIQQEQQLSPDKRSIQDQEQQQQYPAEHYRELLNEVQKYEDRRVKTGELMKVLEEIAYQVNQPIKSVTDMFDKYNNDEQIALREVYQQMDIAIQLLEQQQEGQQQEHSMIQQEQQLSNTNKSPDRRSIQQQQEDQQEQQQEEQKINISSSQFYRDIDSALQDRDINGALQSMIDNIDNINTKTNTYHDRLRKLLKLIGNEQLVQHYNDDIKPLSKKRERDDEETKTKIREFLNQLNL